MTQKTLQQSVDDYMLSCQPTGITCPMVLKASAEFCYVEVHGMPPKDVECGITQNTDTWTCWARSTKSKLGIASSVPIPQRDSLSEQFNSDQLKMLVNGMIICTKSLEDLMKP